MNTDSWNCHLLDTGTKSSILVWIARLLTHVPFLRSHDINILMTDRINTFQNCFFGIQGASRGKTNSYTELMENKIRKYPFYIWPGHSSEYKSIMTKATSTCCIHHNTLCFNLRSINGRNTWWRRLMMSRFSSSVSKACTQKNVAATDLGPTVRVMN
jgi:hypothetical protein